MLEWTQQSLKPAYQVQPSLTCKVDNTRTKLAGAIQIDRMGHGIYSTLHHGLSIGCRPCNVNKASTGKAKAKAKAWTHKAKAKAKTSTLKAKA